MKPYDEYLAFLEESEMSHLTVSDYRATFKRYFATYSELKSEHIKTFISGFKATTKRKYRTQLKALCDYIDVTIDWKRIPSPKVRMDAPLTVTEQHERRIVDFMEYRDHKSARMFQFLLLTGLRISELEGLAPEHYKKIEDVGGKVYHVLQIDTSMDTHSVNGRYVPLTVQARHILDEFGLPFNIDRRRFNDLLIQARRTLHMPDYKIHSLRKTFMSRALKEGVDVVTIANIMGHRDLKTMLDYSDREASTVCDAFLNRKAA